MRVPHVVHFGITYGHDVGLIKRCRRKKAGYYITLSCLNFATPSQTVEIDTDVIVGNGSILYDEVRSGNGLRLYFFFRSNMRKYTSSGLIGSIWYEQIRYILLGLLQVRIARDVFWPGRMVLVPASS